MCGITGYIGHRDAVPIAIEELRRLEYRGYDSAGVAYPYSNGLKIIKLAGKIANLSGAIDIDQDHARTAIAHTRWATHGSPNNDNAHPHPDCHGRIAVVHNGIIENYLTLKEELIEQGHIFQSDTDTEVIAHLIEREIESAPFGMDEAVRRAANLLRGSYSIAVLSLENPGRIVVARKDSPLVLGIGEGENFIASDIPAVIPYTRKVIILHDGDIATVTSDSITIQNLQGENIVREAIHIDWDVDAAEKGGHDHFMIKEIYEQPQAVRDTLRGRILDDDTIEFNELQWSEETWKSFNRVHIIACGTAYNAGLIGKHLFERLVNLPVEVHYASEFRYGNPIIDTSSLAMFISQSGETADTIAALKLCKEKGVKTLGVVNVVGSSIARECDQVAYTQAGPEICVASTKAYSAQVTMMSLLGLFLAQIHKSAEAQTLRTYVYSLRNVPISLQHIISLEPQIKELASKIADSKLMFYLGRGLDAHVAWEGALKIKEIAYMPTQESPAGEMKHGPLALIEEGVSAVFVAMQFSTREKIMSNMKEVKARGGTVVAIVKEGENLLGKTADYTVEIPGIDPEFFGAPLSILPLQLLAYHVALLRGCDIDQPRNLAKSVTVE